MDRLTHSERILRAADTYALAVAGTVATDRAEARAAVWSGIEALDQQLRGAVEAGDALLRHVEPSTPESRAAMQAWQDATRLGGQ